MQNQQTDNKNPDFDEEIYVKGTTVVWSRGCQSEARLVQKSFQLDSPIIKVMGDFETPDGSKHWSFFTSSAHACIDLSMRMCKAVRKDQYVCCHQ